MAIQRITPVHQQGFTLLELMLVILVLGLLISAIRLTVPDQSDRQLQQLAQRLGAQIQLAQQQSVMQNQDLALQFGQHQYAFYRLSNNQWLSLESDSKLATPTLPDSLILKLQIAGQPVDLTQPQSPQVLFLSDGQVSAFALEIGNDASRQQGLKLSTDLLGQVQIDSLGNDHED